MICYLPQTREEKKKEKKNKTKRTKTNAKTHNHSRQPPNYAMALFSSYCGISDATIADVSTYLVEHKFGNKNKRENF